MHTVNIRDAKTHLSRLIERAAADKPFVIIRAGHPLVKVVPIDAPDRTAEYRLGFLAGQAEVPDDFDRMGAATIKDMFGHDD